MDMPPEMLSAMPDIMPAYETSFTPPQRQVPVNYEAEQALLGAILSNNDAFEKVSDFLKADHFADPVNGRIYEAARKLIESGRVADAIQLKFRFESDGALEEIGGAKYLAELQAGVISIINAADYGRTIFDLFLRRELISVGEDVVNIAFDGQSDLEANEQIETAEARLFQLGEHGQVDGAIQSFGDSLAKAVEQAETAFKRDGGLVGVDTGLTAINDKLGGLHPSDLLILAGRPAMGKTALATTMAFNAARKGEAVLFFSLEMSAEQLAARIVARETQLSSDRMRRGDLNREQMDKLISVSRELERIPLYIDDTPAISVGMLRGRARRLKRQHGLRMIMVDYVQLMRGSSSSGENRVQEISEITRGLKAVAKELDVPVMALSQLSRAVENREDKKPQLSDLRESGSIEQDADVVMFVYRPEYYVEKARPIEGTDSGDKFGERLRDWQARMEQVYNKAIVIIGKQRHGPVGDVELFFDGPTTTFRDLTDDERLPEKFS